MDGESIMQQFEDWFEREKVDDQIEEWAIRNAQRLQITDAELAAGADGEQPHEWWPLYLEYQQEFEALLQRFLDEAGCTSEDFLTAVDGASASMASTYASWITSLSSYENFLELMTDEEAKQRRLVAREEIVRPAAHACTPTRMMRHLVVKPWRAQVGLRVSRRLSTSLPAVPEPPLPSELDKMLDRTGKVNPAPDPFSSRKLQGSGGIFRGKDIVPMWIADMDFRAPQPIVNAVVACAERAIYGYTNVPPALTDATLSRLSTVYGCAQPQSEWLSWLPGLVPGLSSACRVARARCGPGNECRVAVLTPAYPPFLKLPAFNGTVLEKVPLRAEAHGAALHFELDWPVLESSLAKPETRLLLLCNPHNPTGRCWSRDELLHVAALCADHNVLLLSDEVWGELPLHPEVAPFTSALALLDDVPSLRERLIVLTSPSKCFNVATLNVAVAATPDATLRAEFAKAGGDMAEVTPFGYFAALAAYTEAESEAWRLRLVSYLKANHEYAAERLTHAVPGVVTTRAESSYLLWVDATRVLSQPDAPNAARLLLEHGVGVSDGSDFGGPAACFRLNLACTRLTLERGLGRIVDALQSAQSRAA